MKRALLISLCIAFAALTQGWRSAAAKDSTAVMQLDSTYLERVKVINDYSMVGLQYGVNLTMGYFNPDRNIKMTVQPINIGIVYTRYGKMFGYMPYFGIQAGIFYTREGYAFQTRESGYTDQIFGASRVVMDCIEVPAMAHLHVDFWKMKLMANIGLYGGYRLGIHRYDYTYDVYEQKYGEYRDKFHEAEYRWDYGIKGGVGFALVLDPIEIHVSGWYKHSLCYLHVPNINTTSYTYDDNSKYYYKWDYLSDITISVGVHYQLTRRKGLPRKTLREEGVAEAKAILEKVKQIDAEKQPEASAEAAEEKNIETNIEASDTQDSDGESR